MSGHMSVNAGAAGENLLKMPFATTKMHEMRLALCVPLNRNTIMASHSQSPPQAKVFFCNSPENYSAAGEIFRKKHCCRDENMPSSGSDEAVSLHPRSCSWSKSTETS